MAKFYTVTNPAHWAFYQTYNIALTKNADGSKSDHWDLEDGLCRISALKRGNTGYFLVSIGDQKPFKIYARLSDEFNPAFVVNKKALKRIKVAIAAHCVDRYVRTK